MKYRFMVYGEFSEISKDGILGHINIWIPVMNLVNVANAFQKELILFGLFFTNI